MKAKNHSVDLLVLQHDRGKIVKKFSGLTYFNAANLNYDFMIYQKEQNCELVLILTFFFTAGEVEINLVFFKEDSPLTCNIHGNTE